MTLYVISHSGSVSGFSEDEDSFPFHLPSLSPPVSVRLPVTVSLSCLWLVGKDARPLQRLQRHCYSAGEEDEWTELDGGDGNRCWEGRREDGKVEVRCWCFRWDSTRLSRAAVCGKTRACCRKAERWWSSGSTSHALIHTSWEKSTRTSSLTL